ncbi:3D domain-containing protein [Hazenella coriacea]|uniref:3D (Asp-Asp-Asp) domain-containing protein n=1 Tax=Hazenella coriacea TaxID=1179467 RepID=A0A4R3L902_9BACL|nr:3D domain-containing protein [Hazenella coriacea]TCS94694.1 3D (Asp-Asp-Asp) domain-containing protein [Hazenella coriacea]
MRKFLRNGLAMFVIPLFVLSAAGCSSSEEVKVSFSDTNKAITFNNSGDTLSDALKEQGYQLADLQKKYEPSIPWDQKLKGQKEVLLKCKCNVSLQIAGGKVETFETLQPTVADVLKERKVELSEWDELQVPLDKQITDGMTIVVDRVEQRLKKRVEVLSYKTKEEKDDKMPEGKKVTDQEGKEGKKIYEVVMLYKNGKPILENGKPMVKEELIHTIKPVDKLVKIGTNKELAEKEKPKLASAGNLTVQATGYTHTGNKTATGTYPSRGTIAVDPRVIPLGTKLYIPGYGYGVAADTGGVVKGNIIDLFFETRSEARNWGRRTVTIQILK